MEQWWRSIGSPRTCAAVLAAWRNAGQPGNASPNAQRWRALGAAVKMGTGGCLTPGLFPSVGYRFAWRDQLIALISGGPTSTAPPSLPPPSRPTTGTPAPKGGPPEARPPEPMPMPPGGNEDETGAIFGQGPEAWGKMLATSTPAEVLRAAQADGADAVNVAVVKSASGVRAIAYRAAGGVWAYFDGERWRLPLNNQIDFSIPAEDVERPAANNQGLGPTRNDKQPVTPATGPAIRGLQGMRASESRRWKCPRGYVQGDPAVFGAPDGQWANRQYDARWPDGDIPEDAIPLCFAKDILPDKFRASQPKTAAVSHSDKENIRKAKTAINRIKRYAKTSGIMPAPRRRRRTESHYHHTHRR